MHGGCRRQGGTTALHSRWRKQPRAGRPIEGHPTQRTRSKGPSLEGASRARVSPTRHGQSSPRNDAIYSFIAPWGPGHVLNLVDGTEAGVASHSPHLPGPGSSPSSRGMGSRYPGESDLVH